ncbi:hypothetical protein ACFVOK_31420 [Streptomyces sp. NPDC057798]|uniref:hypothetical protein n=1 Tax=Streptomyces sp. NPDC057798 TaxID=3346252 RepID=UPI00367EE2F0
MATAAALVTASLGLLGEPVHAAPAAGCDTNHVYGYLRGPLEQGDALPGGTIVSLDLRNSLTQDGIVFRKQWPEGGALGINPTSGTHWFTTRDTHVWSAKPGGAPYNWRELSGPAEKDGFAFAKDGKGYFLVTDNAGPSVYVFPGGRPADRRRVPLSGSASSGTSLADDPPTDLAFSGTGEAWLVTAQGRLWQVRDTTATTGWKATLFGALPRDKSMRIEGLAFGLVDGYGTLVASGEFGDERFIGRIHPSGEGTLAVVPATKLSGFGGVTDLASCLFPESWD